MGKKKWEKPDSTANLCKDGGGGGGGSDVQLGHKNQRNDRDILPVNSKGDGRDCFLSLTAAVKHTQSWVCNNGPEAGEGGENRGGRKTTTSQTQGSSCWKETRLKKWRGRDRQGSLWKRRKGRCKGKVG